MNAINGKFEGINKSNWSGEEVTVTVKNNRFQLAGYDWEITDINEEFLSSGRSIGGWFKLVSGEDWINEAVFLETVDAESIVKSAVAWISNYV